MKRPDILRGGLAVFFPHCPRIMSASHPLAFLRRPGQSQSASMSCKAGRQPLRPLAAGSQKLGELPYQQKRPGASH